MRVTGVMGCRHAVTDEQKKISQYSCLAIRHPLPRCNDEVSLSSFQLYRLLQVVQAYSALGLCSIITCVTSTRVAHAATPPL